MIEKSWSYKNGTFIFEFVLIIKIMLFFLGSTIKIAIFEYYEYEFLA